MPNRTNIDANSERRDRLNLDLNSVHETSRLLTGPMDLQQVLEVVVKTAARAIDAEAAGLRLLDENTGELVLKATYRLSDAYKNKGPVTAGESILNKRALSGEPIVVENMLTDPHFRKYHDEIQREGLVSNLSIGLLYKNKGIGIMRLYNKQGYVNYQFKDQVVNDARHRVAGWLKSFVQTGTPRGWTKVVEDWNSQPTAGGDADRVGSRPPARDRS